MSTKKHSLIAKLLTLVILIGLPFPFYHVLKTASQGAVLGPIHSAAAEEGSAYVVTPTSAYTTKSLRSTGLAGTEAALVDPSVKLLPTEFAGAVVYNDDDGTIVLRNDRHVASLEVDSFITGLQVGDVLASDVSPSVPDGFLRRIEIINWTDASVTIKTSAVGLEDVIHEGEIDTGVVKLSQVDVELAQLITGESVHNATAADGLEIPLKKLVLSDPKGGRVVLDGSVRVDPSFRFRARFSSGRLQSISFENRTIVEPDIEVDIKKPLIGLNSRRTLATYWFKPFTVWVGVLPVVLRPHLSLFVDARGTVSATFSTEIDQTKELQYDLIYTRGLGWSVNKDIKTSNNQVSLPSQKLKFDLGTCVGGELTLAIYGIKGPFANLQGCWLLEVLANKRDWKFLAVVKAEIGVRMRLSILRIEYVHPLHETRRVLGSSNQLYLPIITKS